MQPATPQPRSTVLIFLLITLLGSLLYVWDVRRNPPGFHVDESSVAYNAHLIASTGKDEHGESWPLFFRAFGEYKNPVYIYVLAVVFRFMGPSIAVARASSAIVGLIGAILLGWLALRLSSRWLVAALVLLTAMLTPWLFELSRVVVEVALYPLAIALFLLLVHRSSRRTKWNWVDACSISMALALLTYTYSIGRVFAPLLAVGLALFTTRARLRWLLATWGLYVFTLAPIVVFNSRHPGALQSRFRVLTFITPQSGYGHDAWEFAKHYVGNLNPGWMILTGDPNIDQIASLPGYPPLLIITFLLAAFGVLLLLREPRAVERWWWFVLFGVAAAFVPAALTTEYYHTLRLSPAAVFIIVLTIPALAWLSETRSRSRRLLLLLTLIATVGQGLAFQWQHYHHAHDPQRMKTFDADYPSKILPTALNASGSAPIYLADAPAVPDYIHAWWYATVQRIPLEKFVVLPREEGAPSGAVVISSEGFCARCRKLYEREPLLVYLAEEPPRKPELLPCTAMQAEIRPVNIPQTFVAGEAATIRVAVRNAGEATWYAGERPGVPLQVRLGNHWLSQDLSTVANDDGRAALLRDVAPGQEVEIELRINPPSNSGRYILEIDMLQEGASWFGLKGSKTLRVPVTIGR